MQIESNISFFPFSSASSAIASNTLTKQLLWFSLTHFGTLTWLLDILNLQRKSSKKFSKPGQHGTSSQESSGPGANLGKAKAWSGGTLELEPLWLLKREKWHDIYSGVTLRAWVRARSVIQLCLTLCDPMDYSLPDSSVHGLSSGKNTGMGCHALLLRIFPTQGSNPGLLHCRQILYHLSHQGGPWWPPRKTKI